MTEDEQKKNFRREEKMKTFDEWCQDREIVLNELSPKFLAMAYKIWGEECFVEGQRYEAENAALRERLKKAVEFPIKCGDYVYDVVDGTAYKTQVLELRINIHGDLWCKTVSSYFPLELLGKRIFLTKEAAEARLKELQGGESE